MSLLFIILAFSPILIPVALVWPFIDSEGRCSSVFDKIVARVTKPRYRKKLDRADKKFDRYMQVRKRQHTILSNDWLRIFGEDDEEGGKPILSRLQNSYNINRYWEAGKYDELLSALTWYPGRDLRNCKCVQCYAGRGKE